MNTDETLEAREERDAYQALCLMPGAPQELVVETYWHLVQKIMADAPSDKEAQADLESLNRAYALVTRPDVAARPVQPEPEEPKRKRTPLRHKLLKRNTARPAPRNPWDVLQVQPSAPQEVVDIAYRFWQVRLRNAWYDAAGTQRESLDEAYASLRSPAPSAAGAAPAPELQEPVPAPPSPAPTPAPASHEPAAGPVVPPSTPASAPPPALPTPPLTSEQPDRPIVTHTEPETTLVPDSAEPPQQDEPAPVPTPIRRGIRIPLVARSGPSALANETSPPSVEREPSLVEPDHSSAAPDSLVTAPPPDPLAQALRNSPVPAVASLQPDRAPSPPAQQTPSAPPAAKPHLALENGLAPGHPVEVGATPVHITADNGHVEVSSSNSTGLVARVWSLGEHVMFHAVASEPICRINGRQVTWVVLEDGDTIQVGTDLIRFHHGRHP